LKIRIKYEKRRREGQTRKGREGGREGKGMTSFKKRKGETKRECKTEIKLKNK
jgi:hypothetical protein